MGETIFIILSMVVALYAAYLLTCCLYETDYRGEPADKVIFPRIVYFLVFIVAFVPILNLICVMMLLVFLCLWSDDYRVNSWLFEKPEEKEEADQNK